MLPVSRGQCSVTPAAVFGAGNRMASLFDRILNDEMFAVATPPSAAARPICVWEDENQFVVEVDMPGVADSDLDITAHNDVLTIRGERKRERQGKGGDYRAYGKFEYRVALPNWAKTDAVNARLVNGVLSLEFAKGDEAKPRKIAVGGQS